MFTNIKKAGGEWIGEGGGRNWELSPFEDYGVMIWKAVATTHDVRPLKGTLEQIDKKLRRLKDRPFQEIGLNSDKRRTIQAEGKFYIRYAEEGYLIWTAPFPVKTLEDERKAWEAYWEYAKKHGIKDDNPPGPRRKAERKVPKKHQIYMLNRRIKNIYKTQNGDYMAEVGGVHLKVRHTVKKGKREWSAWAINAKRDTLFAKTMWELDLLLYEVKPLEISETKVDIESMRLKLMSTLKNREEKD